MTKDEAIERIKTGNYCGEYGFDLQILIDCALFMKELLNEMEVKDER